MKGLTITASILPRLYGLPKTHKANVPMRPIVSTINSTTSKLSQLLAGVLHRSFINRTSYNVQDSFDFVERVKDIIIPESHVLVSFDVSSLFTNIPMQLVLQIIEDEWDRISPHTTFSKESFIRALRFINNNAYFTFQGKCYKQKWGTQMGSSLGPSMALIVMDALLDWAVPRIGVHIPLILKYVDDIFAVVPKDSINRAVAELNTFHPRLQFTFEMENNGSLPFLDTMVTRRPDGSLLLDWYQKPTASGRYLNYHSAHTTKQKMNLLIGMRTRVQRICHPSLVNKKFKLLVDIFENNGYPTRLLRKVFGGPISITSSPRPILPPEDR